MKMKSDFLLSLRENGCMVVKEFFITKFALWLCSQWSIYIIQINLNQSRKLDCSISDSENAGKIVDIDPSHVRLNN